MYYTIVKATSSVCATDTQQLFGKKTQREILRSGAGLNYLVIIKVVSYFFSETEIFEAVNLEFRFTAFLIIATLFT